MKKAVQDAAKSDPGLGIDAHTGCETWLPDHPACTLLCRKTRGRFPPDVVNAMDDLTINSVSQRAAL